MKKILVLVLATLMSISLCACGGSESTSGNNNSETKTEENGFTPSQVTEKEEVEETTTAPANMTIEEMQQYYDVTKYLGSPCYDECKIKVWDELGVVQINRMAENGVFPITIEDNGQLENGKTYGFIICDNDTPDDLSDDVVAYVFTTPIE